MASATYFSTVVSKQGLDYIWTAYPTGPLIDISYFVPIYDYRIDPTIMENGVALSAFSAVAYDTAVNELTTPVGEKIWYTDVANAYNLTSPNYLISAIAGEYQYDSEVRLNNPIQTAKPTIGVNIYNGHPLVASISGATMEYSLVDDRWTVTNYTVVSGSNAPTGTSAASLYRTVDYYPVYETSGGGNLRGSFTCRLNVNNGKFKFNKIAFYAVRRNLNGTFYGGDGTPFFFGEAYIQEPVIKSTFGNAGLDDFICTVQFNIQSVTSAFNNVFYSTSGDYWQRGLGGLHYPLKVGVGSFNDVDSEPDAVVHIRPSRTSANNSVDYNIPNLRMDYDIDKWVSFKTNMYGGVEISAATMSAAHTSALATSIYPYWGGTVGLGEGGREFGQLWLENRNTFAANINDGEILLGSVYGIGATETSAYSYPAIVVQDRTVEILKGDDDYCAFVGGDIYKRNNDLLMFNVVTSGTPNHVSIVAGLDINGNYASYDTQDGWSHENLYYQLIYNNEYNNNLVNGCKLHLAAKGGINLHGMLELQPIGDPYGNMTEWLPFEYGTAFVIARNRKIGLFSGLIPNISYATLNSVLEASKASIASMLTQVVGVCGSTIYLVGKTIETYGDFIPFVDEQFSIGTYDYRFNTLYSDTIDSRLSSAAILNIAQSSSLIKWDRFDGMHLSRQYMRNSGDTISLYSYLLPETQRAVTGRTINITTSIGTVTQPFNYMVATNGRFTNLTVENLIYDNDEYTNLGDFNIIDPSEYSVKAITTSGGGGTYGYIDTVQSSNVTIGYVKINKIGYLIGKIYYTGTYINYVDTIHITFTDALDDYFNVTGRHYYSIVQAFAGPLPYRLTIEGSYIYPKDTRILTGLLCHESGNNVMLIIREPNGVVLNTATYGNEFYFKIPVELV